MAVRRRPIAARQPLAAAPTPAAARPLAAVLLLIVPVLVAALAAACSAQATMGATGSGSPASRGPSVAAAGGDDASAGGARAASGADWARVLSALALMRATTPAEPVVVLLGGSSARESTVSDKEWRAQIEDKGGPAATAWNMGSRNRTMAQNVAIVKALPPGVRAIVYIGINLGAFTSARQTATISLPTTAPSSVSLQQPHQYSEGRILSRAKKKSLVDAWIADRYPVFKRNFSTSAGVLEKLIRVCRARGYRPVLLELPRDIAIIGGRLSAPTAKYRERCRALAGKYGIPYVNLEPEATLPDSSFYDLWHLVEPGREVWQDLLSERTAALLEQYGYDGEGP